MRAGSAEFGVRPQQGFTYVAVLILVATLGAVGAAFGELTSHAVQREKEQELLFVGNQYRQAIASYYRKEQRYPQTLADLLQDRRYPMPVRHLRKPYPDPLTGGPFGLLAAPQGGVMGVASTSEERPVKSAGFAYRERGFEKAAKYSEWRFVHVPDSPIGPGHERSQETAK